LAFPACGGLLFFNEKKWPVLGPGLPPSRYPAKISLQWASLPNGGLSSRQCHPGPCSSSAPQVPSIGFLPAPLRRCRSLRPTLIEIVGPSSPVARGLWLRFPLTAGRLLGRLHPTQGWGKKLQGRNRRAGGDWATPPGPFLFPASGWRSGRTSLSLFQKIRSSPVGPDIVSGFSGIPPSCPLGPEGKRTEAWGGGSRGNN
jgi:hypothetical protein